MAESSKIDYISKTDFSKGVQRFHVTWPLKNLSRPKESSIFKTTLIDGQQTINLSWSLGIINQKNGTDTWFGVHLKSSDKTIPIIYQVSLSSSSNILFNRSCIAVINGESNGYGHIVPSKEVDGYLVNDLVLHFWMDIPTAAALGASKKRKWSAEDDIQDDEKSTDKFMLDTVKMFSRVTGTEFDSLSDVSVIIVKKVEEVVDGQVIKKEEELRRFHCHSIFLAARSTVFETLFACEEWKETCAKEGRSVRISDIDAQIMESVLRYIYTSSLPDPSTSQDGLSDLVYASDKYNLTELKDGCVSILILNRDSVQSRFKQLVLADRHNLVQLKAVCIAQLSLDLPTAFSDRALVSDLSDDLYSDIMKAVSERRAATTEIAVE